ncbi:MAG: HD domain-containing protein [Akkermansia sp.]
MDRLSLKDINQLPQDCPVEAEIFAQIAQRATKSTRNNKPYLDVHFADAEATLNVKVWEDKPWYRALMQVPERSFVSLSGIWGKGNFGCEVNDLQVRLLNNEEQQILLLGTPELMHKQQADWETIMQLVSTMSDPRLRTICQLFITKFEARFRRAGAARAYHHARRGGLCEHIAGMMRATIGICEAYRDLNRDLILSGCLFHDCGKLWENCYGEADFTMPYTEAGELLGHIPLGIELVNSLWKESLSAPDAKGWITLDPPSSDVRMHLLHLIASHHGELAFGSPVTPKTPEAMALHYIDNLDAKIEMFRTAYQTGEMLADDIFQKKAPLPGNEVRPLASFIAIDIEDDTKPIEPIIDPIKPIEPIAHTPSMTPPATHPETLL